MKKILLFLIGLTPIICTSKEFSNQIGIGFGNIYYNPNTFRNDEKLSINSPFFNRSNYDSFYETITIQTPGIYYSKKIFKNITFRTNASYFYRTFYIDRTGWIIEPDPLYFDRNYYYNVSYTKILKANIGFQYDFVLGKFKIYPALENALEIDWFKCKEYYTLTSNPYEKNVEIYKHKSINRSINLLLGFEYKCDKRISISYETGLYQNYFSILSRFSINYIF